jgi:hypothetical protein
MVADCINPPPLKRRPKAMAEEIVMATSRSAPQEITLKSTHIHRIESGDILEFRLKRGLGTKAAREVSEALEELKNSLASEHGKKVYFLVTEEGEVNITHYRAVEAAEEEEKKKTMYQQHPWQL